MSWAPRAVDLVVGQALDRALAGHGGEGRRQDDRRGASSIKPARAEESGSGLRSETRKACRS